MWDTEIFRPFHLGPIHLVKSTLEDSSFLMASKKIYDIRILTYISWSKQQWGNEFIVSIASPWLIGFRLEEHKDIWSSEVEMGLLHVTYKHSRLSNATCCWVSVIFFLSLHTVRVLCNIIRGPWTPTGTPNSDLYSKCHFKCMLYTAQDLNFLSWIIIDQGLSTWRGWCLGLDNFPLLMSWEMCINEWQHWE